MPRFLRGVVAEITQRREGLLRIIVEVPGKGGERRPAAVLTELTGPVDVGDLVVLNVTAQELGLGTGGEDFVVFPVESTFQGEMSGGHILKMRYTPAQIDVLATEAPESTFHPEMTERTSLDGTVVVVCGLHSQIAPVVSVVKKQRPETTVAYLMSDAASLPLALSDLVHECKNKGLIQSTVTVGHAFGGDLEAVNVYSGLICAKVAAGADLIVVAPGPGIVGTDTPLGHSGMDQGICASAAAALGGRVIAVARMSWADKRPRHRGLSHHFISSMLRGALLPCTIALPMLDAEKNLELKEACEPLADRHEVRLADGDGAERALDEFGLEVRTMGRAVSQDREFFKSGGAAAMVALEMLDTK